MTDELSKIETSHRRLPNDSIENDDDEYGGIDAFDDEHGSTLRTAATTSRKGFCGVCADLLSDLWNSSGLVLNHKLNLLLFAGPLALLGDAMGMLGETACFALSGIALIPCAERLSFVTEQVAMHTNGTIGALLNATFGNAPELLIASAALRKGFYRVVQLAMLGSMLTNLLFVFGISCLIGGLRWQVQELRITSGNVNVGMLLLSTAGSLLPATLVLGGQLKHGSSNDDATDDDTTEQQSSFADPNAVQPSLEELQFCRINASVLIFMYGLYLVFQLGTHKEEFDDDEGGHEHVNGTDHREYHTAVHGKPSKHHARRNVFCVWLLQKTKCMLSRNGNDNRVRMSPSHPSEEGWIPSSRVIATDPRSSAAAGDVEMMYRNHATNNNKHLNHQLLGMIPNEREERIQKNLDDGGTTSSSDDECLLPQNHHKITDDDDSYFDEYRFDGGLAKTETSGGGATRLRRNSHGAIAGHPHSASTPNHHPYMDHDTVPNGINSSNHSKKKKNGRSTGALLPLGLAEPSETMLPTAPSQPPLFDGDHSTTSTQRSEAQMSFRVGILWLLIITLGISAMSDILVDTIDGFALRLHVSEVFTSMVIVPFFSNVAEQVSAILFAYRNEMDLCVGVTVGSAIQVASFVLPGCVLIGWMVDRSMTLYFHAYETVCLFLAVVVVAAVLQGGTTNWLVGATCISVYVMMAAGFWFHSLEDLSVDAETIGQDPNGTRRATVFGLLP